MPVHIPTCHHLKANGVWCGSPALRGHRFCYFHHQWREHDPELKPDAKPAPFELPLLEDANGVQVALQRVMQAILNDEIDHRKAGLLLFALQTASSNLKNTHFDHPALDRQAQAEYASGDSAEDDDPDACDICAYNDEEEEEDDEEQNEEEQEGQDEEEQEGENEEEHVKEENEEEEKEAEQQPAAQQSAAQQPVTVTAAAPEAPAAAPEAPAPVSVCGTAAPGCAPSAAAHPSARPAKLPPRTSPLPEHDEELDDKELIKMIRQLAGLT